MSDRSLEIAATLAPETAAGASADPWLGRVLGNRYRLLEKLGEGGMGAVFIAEHLMLRNRVALKIIHATFEGHAEIAARFAREAMVSARIEHPHVVSALDYGALENGGAYLVMQLVRGEGLRKKQREGIMPWELACELIAQMASAVAAAHEAGIVHRDLKPENVVLEARGDAGFHVKVLDFGIAHLRADPAGAHAATAGTQLTRVGTVIGTPGYMSPEQAVGQPVDERTDIYALGVMLWELLAGRRPFDGNTLTEIVTKQFAAQAPALPEGAQVIPSELATLLAQMLAPRAEDRPRSAAEIRDRMRAMKGLGTPAPVQRTTLASVQTRLLAASTRHKVLLAAALLLVLLLTVFSGGESESSAVRDRASDTAQRDGNDRSAAEEPAAQGQGSSRSKGPLRTRARRAFNSIFH
ncbi:MAG: serine/threonine-protein kinase [Myxococcales bacterium]